MARRRRKAVASFRDDLYGEWREMDDARTRRADELWRIVETPAETVGGIRMHTERSTAEQDEGAPRASQESVGPICRRCAKAAEPTIPGPSGRRYVIRQTKAGNTYGIRRGVVLVVNGRHAIERSNVGTNVEAVVDRLTPILETRAKAVENARAVVPTSEWPKLDAMLVRWFKRPGTWRGTRERIERCIRYMNLDTQAEGRAMKALNTMALRGTWAS